MLALQFLSFFLQFFKCLLSCTVVLIPGNGRLPFVLLCRHITHGILILLVTVLQFLAWLLATILTGAIVTFIHRVIRTRIGNIVGQLEILPVFS